MTEKTEAWDQILKKADLKSSWPQKIQVDHETFEAVERDEQQKLLGDGSVRILSKMKERQGRGATGGMEVFVPAYFVQILITLNRL